MNKFQTKLTLQLLLAVLLLLSVQNSFAQESLYSSDSYKVAFQPPEGAEKNAESTAGRVIYDAVKGNNGLKPRFEFDVASEAFANAELSRQLGTADGLEQFVAGAVDGFKKELKGAEITVTEKKRIKLAGFNAVKFVASASVAGVKMRLASYSVVVPEHKRMYNFFVFALEDDFDEWLSAAEKSVYSFALLKPTRK